MIKQFTDRHNLTQSDLANLLGVTDRTIRNWGDEPPKLVELALKELERQIETQR